MFLKNRISKTGLTLLLIVVFSLATFTPAMAALLAWGSQGSDVSTCQWKLKQWGYYGGSIDGIYGTETSQAVKSFQRRNGLEADGMIGTATRAAMGLSGGPGYGGAPSGGSSELLARLIMGEAEAEPYVGKVAVGAVILNRVQNPKFPKSIAGVIYQPGAFESVQNGQINKTPTAEARRAAVDALKGWDPTYNSIFFFNPAKTSNAFMWSRKMSVRIGNHLFGH
ncbi:MAG: spore cortex-lytic enzyme [Firmicutes bacterium]|nr:spore cortex-lytic enzyme [Bacillota bacterium]